MEKPITKKAAKAASVEANKRAAYVKKVRSLIGYVGERIAGDVIGEAYERKIDAFQFAAEVVAKEPVGKAVWPLKSDAVKSATLYANNVVKNNLAELEAVGFDANKLAPYPKYNGRGTWEERKERSRLADKHSEAHRFVSPATDADEREKYNENETRLACMVKRDAKKIAKFIAGCEEQTADQYNLFVLKLVQKIGPDAQSATIEGSHVWGHSILTVTKECGRLERWKTQQITNCSVLGKYFPQWPTRLMKG